METDGFPEFRLDVILAEWWKTLLVVGLVVAIGLLLLGQTPYLALLFSGLFDWAIVCEVARFKGFNQRGGN